MLSSGAAPLDASSRPYLILLRGMIRDARHWYGMEKILQQELPQMEVLLWDLPQPSSWRDVKKYSRPALLAELLLQKVGATRSFHVVGLSLGGLLGLYLKTHYPQRCLSVVMINSSHPQCSAWYQRISWGFVVLFLIKRCLSVVWAERHILEGTLQNKLVVQRMYPKAVMLQKTSPWTFKTALYQLLLAVRIVDVPVAESREQSVLVLYGAKDQIVSPQCSRALASRMQVRCLEHPAAGHDLPLDDGAWCVKRVTDFVSDLSS